MGMRLAAIVVLAISVSPAFGGYYRNGEFREPCNDLPPLSAMAEPSVPYEVVAQPSDDIQISCGGPFARIATACARWVDPTSADDGWVIYIDNGLSADDFACVLIYEKAHLPPNNWADQKWETYVRHGGSDPR